MNVKDLKRLIAIAIFLFTLFALLVLQFYKIQVIEGEKWRKAADRQHRLSVVEPYRRGLFYSNTTVRKGHPETPLPFVIDVPRFHLYADPGAIPVQYREEIAQALQKMTRFSTQEMAKVRHQLERKSRSRRLVLWLMPEMKEAILKWWQPYAKSHQIPRNALFFVQDYQRAYPFGKLLGQVLHTVRSERDPVMRECVPTGGLELSLNRYLKGEDGRRVILRSPRQPLDIGKVIKEPQHGSDVYLTINHHLQAIAEEEVKQGVIKAEAKSGWAVIMDPYTGEILAWAEYPFFEPARYRDFFNDPKKEQATKTKAITDPYEPGSTMKAMTLAIALKANAERISQGKPPLFSTEEKIAVGVAHLPGRSKPLTDIHRCRFANFEIGTQKSSNIYMARLMQRVVENMGEAWYRDALEKVFGFGVKTGIELAGESGGLLPTPGKKHPNGKVEWDKGTPYCLALGYNMLANSLQMVRAYAILANGGFDVKPTLVKKVINSRGEVIFELTPPAPKRLLDKEIVDTVVHAMRYVTKPGGTARRADIPTYTEVGKTGTAEKIINGVYSKKDHISTFVGFAPAINPRFVLLVAIDEPAYKYIPGVGKNQMGGVCAAPLFASIGLKALQYLGVPPDDPQNEAWTKEISDLKKIYDAWNH